MAGVQRAPGLTRAATAQPGPQLGGLPGCGDRRPGWQPPCAPFPLGHLFSLSDKGLASTYCPRCWGWTGSSGREPASGESDRCHMTAYPPGVGSRASSGEGC